MSLASYASGGTCTLPYPDRYHAAVKFTEIKQEGDSFGQETQLLFYALKQQVTAGPCTTAKPSTWGWNVVENAKWQAWKQLGEISGMEAMRLFVRTLDEERPDWYTALVAAEAAGTAADGLATTNSAALAGAASNGAPGTASDSGAAAGPTLPVASFVSDDGWAAVTTHSTTTKRPCPRYEHSAAVLGQFLYVVGGNYAGRYLSDVWRLDVTTSTWHPLTITSPPPADATTASSDEATPPAPAAGLAALAGHTMTNWEGKLLIVGGHVKAKSSQAGGPMPVRVMDPAASTITELTTTGAPIARGGHSATLVGKQLWVFGGEDATRKPLDELHCLDLESLSWSEPQVQTLAVAPKNKSTWPGARSSHSAVAYGNRYVVVFGGGSTATCYADIQVLDTQAEGGPAWLDIRVRGDKVSPRAGHSAAVSGATMFVVGGGNNVRGCTDLLALDLSPLDGSAGTVSLGWTVLSSTPPRDPLSSEGVSLMVLPAADDVSDPVLMAFGGYNGKYHNVISVLKAKATVTGTEARTEAGSAGGAEGQADSGAEIQADANGSAAKQEPAATPAPAAQIAPKASQPAPALTEADVLKSEVIRLKAALTAAQEEAEGAVKAAAAASAENGHELALLRKQLATCQASLDTATKGLEDARAALARESARVLRLEAEVAELKHELGAAAEDRAELAKLRKQIKEEAEANKKTPGIWGYITG